jgi:hypothetical protein
MLTAFICSCSSQASRNKIITENKLAADTTNKPKTDIRVNKKYDDKGNLIEFDSTYSYFYSNPHLKGNILADSLINDLKLPLKNNFDENMNSIFFNDSLFKYDFFNNDYFSKRFEMNRKQIENMFHQMDSVKSEMFRKNYPNGNIKKNGSK